MAQLEESITAPEDIFSPIDRTQSDEQKGTALAALAESEKSTIEKLARAIDDRLGTCTEVSIKPRDRILSKAKRPDVRRNKPWFRVEHVRDALRFRTRVGTLSDLVPIAEVLCEQGVRFVKVDTAKMFSPNFWGWRFVAFDIRLPSGLLVEYYVSLTELIDENQNHHHRIFEKWRNTTAEERIDRAEDYQKDIEASYNGFESAWERALSRLKLTDDEAKAQLNAITDQLLEQILRPGLREGD